MFELVPLGLPQVRNPSNHRLKEDRGRQRVQTRAGSAVRGNAEPKHDRFPNICFHRRARISEALTTVMRSPFVEGSTFYTSTAPTVTAVFTQLFWEGVYLVLFRENERVPRLPCVRLRLL